MFGNVNTNRTKAVAAWGADAPAWVLTLADACDRTNQRAVADQLGKSGGYVSRIINRSYAGSYPEAETLVRATLSAEEVICPLYGQMPLKTCIRNRRRVKATNWLHAQFARTCPECPNNTDHPHAQEA